MAYGIGLSQKIGIQNRKQLDNTTYSSSSPYIETHIIFALHNKPVFIIQNEPVSKPLKKTC